MSSDATLRELKAGLEDNTTMAVPQPWSFRPMDAEAWSRRYRVPRRACKLIPRSPHHQGEFHACRCCRCCDVVLTCPP